MAGQLDMSRKSWVYRIPDNCMNLIPFLCICIIIASEVMKLQAEPLQKIFRTSVVFFTTEKIKLLHRRRPLFGA